MIVFKLHSTFFYVFKLYNAGWGQSRPALDCFSQLWLKFWSGIDKYWIVPVRKLFYFHHWWEVTVTAVRSVVG